MTSRRYQYLTALGADLLMVVLGMTLGWPSPYLSGPKKEVTGTDQEIAWCIVMPISGSPFGSLITTLVLDRTGRKLYVLLQAPLLLISLILIAYIRHIYVVSVARFMIGLSQGALFTTLPIYFGEISDSKVRGAIGTSMIQSLLLGVLLINAVGSYVSIQTSTLWTLILPILGFFILTFAPESPYYLIRNGDLLAAKNALSLLRGTKDVEAEVNELIKAVERQEKDKLTSYLDLVRVKLYRKGIFIYMIIGFCNKFTGTFPIMFYTAQIFKTAEGTLSAIGSTLIYNSAGLFGTCLGSLVIDRFGRRPLLLISCAGSAFMLAAEASYFTLQNYNVGFLQLIGWIPLTALVGLTLAFSLGLSFGCVVVLSEIFPTSIKVKAVGIVDALDVILGLITSTIFHQTVSAFGMYVPFWIFSVSCAVGVLFIYVFVPERKGKTLEDIQIELLRK